MAITNHPFTVLIDDVSISSSIYTIWLFNIAMENHNFLIGKPPINGPFSMAMLNNQRVSIDREFSTATFDSPREINHA
jgi:hypothetical protein